MAAEGMSGSEQSLIYGFLLNAIIRTEQSNILKAGRRASSLLRRVLDLDEDALAEVNALCRQADGWEGWRDSSSQVRAALNEHVARGRTLIEAKLRQAAEDTGNEPSEDWDWPGNWLEYDERFQASGATGARVAADLALLDAWTSQGRSLADFLGLWDPAPDPLHEDGSG